MEDKDIVINSEDLKVYLHRPRTQPYSERFAQAGTIKQVILHGKHEFCQPEQKLNGRVTCHGQGLCSEFVWDELAMEAKALEYFPKIGVGLLQQRAEGGLYDMWKHYKTIGFPISVQVEKNKVVFIQSSLPCLGVAAELIKTVEVYRNTLTITTILKNTGKRVLNLKEYQHNFVAIDNLPIGPGYQLEIPFDGTIQKIQDSAVLIQDYITPVKEVLEAKGQVINWNQAMTQTAIHKVTEQSLILSCPEYKWQLSHLNSNAKISETVYFLPSKLVIWGIEHCICAEIYETFCVEPGESQISVRTWRFEDDLTGR